MGNNLEKAIEEEVASFALSLAVEGQSQLVPPQQRAKAIASKLEEEIKASRKKTNDGMAYCMSALRELAPNDPEIEIDQLTEELSRCFGKLDTPETMQRLGQKAIEGERWKELLGISDKALSQLYKGAKWLLEVKRYQEAESAFYILATLDAAQPVFWLGLGHAHFHQKEFNEALAAYQSQAQCDPSAFWPHLYAATCFEALQDWPNALLELEAALKLLHESANFDRDFESAIQERLITAKNLSKSS
jgi:tetratricopeptide (TPR) repeat protein